MDNGNFAQQFTQNVKAAAAQPAMYEAKIESTGSSKLPFIVAIALAAITFMESIVLIITLTNYFSLVNSQDYDDAEADVITDDSYVDTAYAYDEDYNLTAMELTCTAEDGDSYTFTKSNTYTGGGTSGTYTITNDSLVALSASGKVLYYDGFDLADGLTIYACQEATTE